VVDRTIVGDTLVGGAVGGAPAVVVATGSAAASPDSCAAHPTSNTAAPISRGHVRARAETGFGDRLPVMARDGMQPTRESSPASRHRAVLLAVKTGLTWRVRG
jgi:hypothetical protein